MELGFEFKGELWVHEGPAAWYFLTLPVDLADEIHDLAGEAQRPFGSIRVEARINDVTWSTSIFRDTKRESYVLPVKATVRKMAGVSEGDEVLCALSLNFDGT